MAQPFHQSVVTLDEILPLGIIRQPTLNELVKGLVLGRRAICCTLKDLRVHIHCEFRAHGLTLLVKPDFVKQVTNR
jgi:hypothetical protein